MSIFDIDHLENSTLSSFISAFFHTLIRTIPLRKYCTGSADVRQIVFFLYLLCMTFVGQPRWIYTLMSLVLALKRMLLLVSLCISMECNNKHYVVVHQDILYLFSL